jgi:RNA polymerase sigma-70 factor, ECF subfamily
VTDVAQLYTTYKPLLFSLAYRMVGTITDAEDMVQDTFLSLERTRTDEIHNIKAFLCRTLTNKCIDFLRRARKQREVYVGPWLPEPLVLTSEEGDPVHEVMTHDRLSIACLMLMESLSPTERAVFVLREVLACDYREIAELVGKTEANCRKIFSRVRQKLSHRLPDEPIDYAQHKQLVERFLAAMRDGDADTLLALLAEEVTLYSDGGGKVRAAIFPICTRERVLAFLLGVAKKTSAFRAGRMANVNGMPGLLCVRDNRLFAVMSCSVRSGRVEAIYLILNPEKLRHVPAMETT